MATKKTKTKEMVKVESKPTTIRMTEIMKKNLEDIKAKQHELSGIRLNNSGAIALALAAYAESLVSK